MTIQQMGSYVYHTLLIDGITYLCATDNASDMGSPSAFLREVSDTFTRNPLMSQEHFSPSNAVAADFQQVLGQYMMKYNNNQVDSMISIRSQVNDIKNDLIQNTDIILEKEDRLNAFLDETNDLSTTVKEFQKTTDIPRRIRWEYFTKIIIITMTILLSIMIILLSTNVIPP
ncbi:vesicle-associated membrane protein 714-like isoform X2 [Octodon degus]|nr:vesicle-associated membrane protein 714-like isoform X2 [Octodon degus]XP_023559263.1 vesicle-associated membrane protein 714-like isoform X2 [Octodon degus]